MRPSRRALIGLALATTLLVAMLVMVNYSQTPPPLPLPNPNGYDDLIRAGRLVVQSTNQGTRWNLPALRTQVATNAEALRLLRLGLSRQCVMPLDTAISNFANLSKELAQLKSLSGSLVDEGELAEQEDRPMDAANSYVDSMRVGAAMSHGGFLINRLVGIACEAQGNTRLIKLLPKLDCSQLTRLATELERLDASNVSWPEVMLSEKRFSRSQMGRFLNPIMLAVSWWESRSSVKAAREKHDLAAGHLRLLSIELALRAYQCSNGKPAAGLTDLLPNYLQRIPVDPFSNHGFIYHPGATNWLLYSLGPDRVDDGGKTFTRTAASALPIGLGSNSARPLLKGDLLFDSTW